MQREIPRGEWAQFLNDYSREHEGQLATLEVTGRDVGDQVAARSMPLHGVTYEEKGSDKDSVSIFFGQETDSDETHMVSAPAHIAVMDGDELALESRDGTRTILHFENRSYRNDNKTHGMTSH